MLVAGLTPGTAMARQTENEAASCADPKHRHEVVRSLTEALPVRKPRKARVRRILM